MAEFGFRSAGELIKRRDHPVQIVSVLSYHWILMEQTNRNTHIHTKRNMEISDL